MISLSPVVAPARPTAAPGGAPRVGGPACSAGSRSASCSPRRTRCSSPWSSPTRSGWRSGSASTTTSSPRPGRGRRPAVRRASTTTRRRSTDPAVRRSFRNVLVFLVINVPLTVVLSLLLATALNGAIRGPDLPAGRPTTCRTSRPAWRWSAVWLFLFSRRRPGQPGARAAGARPVLAGQQHAGDAADRAVRHLEAARLLHPAVPGRAAERSRKELYEAASMDGAGRLRSLLQRHRARGPVRRPRWSSSWRSSPGRTCSPSRTC